MNRQKTVLLTLAALVLGLIGWRVISTNQKPGHKKFDSSLASPIPEEKIEKIPVVQSGDRLSTEQGQAIQKDISSRFDEFKRMFDTRIDFYGKVIDEHGNPVAGAATSYSVATMNLNADPLRDGPTTDSEGRFSIIGKRGPALDIEVKHPKYYETETAKQSFNYGGPIENDAPPLPTRDKPAIFVLRTKGRAEPLIHHKLIEIQLPVDGRPVSLDLGRGAVGAGNDSIRFTLHSDGSKLKVNEFHPFDWGLTVEVPGGGLQERQDDFQFQAPSDGYIESIHYTQAGSLAGGQWQGLVEGDLFIRLPSGHYSRIHLHMRAEKGWCQIESYLNPSGSQDLEAGKDATMNETDNDSGD